MLLPAFAGPGFGWSCCDVVGGVGRVVLVVLQDGFWLSVKGSSMLSIVRECRGGLLSRHRAWEEEKGGRRGGGSMVIKLIMRMQRFIFKSCVVLFTDLDTVSPPSSAICLAEVS